MRLLYSNLCWNKIHFWSLLYWLLLNCVYFFSCSVKYWTLKAHIYRLIWMFFCIVHLVVGSPLTPTTSSSSIMPPSPIPYVSVCPCCFLSPMHCSSPQHPVDFTFFPLASHCLLTQAFVTPRPLISHPSSPLHLLACSKPIKCHHASSNFSKSVSPAKQLEARLSHFQTMLWTKKEMYQVFGLDLQREGWI